MNNIIKHKWIDFKDL